MFKIRHVATSNLQARIAKENARDNARRQNYVRSGPNANAAAELRAKKMGARAAAERKGGKAGADLTPAALAIPGDAVKHEPEHDDGDDLSPTADPKLARYRAHVKLANSVQRKALDVSVLEEELVVLRARARHARIAADKQRANVATLVKVAERATVQPVPPDVKAAYDAQVGADTPNGRNSTAADGNDARVGAKPSSPGSDDGDRPATGKVSPQGGGRKDGSERHGERDRYQIGSFASLPPPRVAPTLPGPDGVEEEDDPAARDTRGLVALEQSYANLYARRAALEGI